MKPRVRLAWSVSSSVLLSVAIGCGGGESSSVEPSDATESSSSTTGGAAGPEGDGGADAPAPDDDGTDVDTGEMPESTGDSPDPDDSGSAGSTGSNDACADCPTEGVAATACVDNQCVAAACTDDHLLCGEACCPMQSSEGGPSRITRQLPDGRLVHGTGEYTEDEQTVCQWYAFEGGAWTVDEHFLDPGQVGCDAAYTDAGERHIVYHLDDGPLVAAHVAVAAHESEGWAEEIVLEYGSGTSGLGIGGHQGWGQQLFARTSTSGGSDLVRVWDGDDWSVFPDVSAGDDRWSYRLDTQGRPHIVEYIDHAECIGYRSPVAVDGFEPFEVQEVDCTEPDDFWFAMALDAEDQPHLVYHSHQSHELRWAHRVDGEWVRTVVDFSDTEEPGAGEGLGIAIDALGHPHIPFDTSSGPRQYAQYDGRNWLFRDLEGYVRGPFIDHDNNVHLVGWGVHLHP